MQNTYFEAHSQLTIVLVGSEQPLVGHHCRVKQRECPNVTAANRGPPKQCGQSDTMPDPRSAAWQRSWVGDLCRLPAPGLPTQQDDIRLCDCLHDFLHHHHLQCISHIGCFNRVAGAGGNHSSHVQNYTAQYLRVLLWWFCQTHAACRIKASQR